MTKRQRLAALVAGRPVDRVPRALWHHFPHADYDRDAFVNATLAFQRRHDMDLLKIGPRSSYCVRDYGAREDVEVDFLGRCRYVTEVIHSPGDWRLLRPLDPTAGSLGHTADCIRGIVAGADRDTPVVATIFSPAVQAKNLAGESRFLAHWRDHPSEVRAGLATLTESIILFLNSLDDVQVDGLFYTIQECGRPELSPSYTAMCAEFDHAILSARPYWLNILHLHGKIAGFDDFASYPVQALHWDEAASGISLAEGRSRFPGVVSGGLAWPDDGWPDARAVKNAARTAASRLDGERLLLGAGCVIPHATPAEYIDAFCSFDS